MSRLRGSMVALVTPFRNGVVDEPALRALARWQIEQGTDGLVPCGTTGAGLPVGLQMVARHFDEARLLSAAQAFELGGGFAL